MFKKSLFQIFFFALMSKFNTVLATDRVDEGYKISDKNKVYLQIIKNNPSLIIDSLNSQGYEVYGPKGLKIWLGLHNIPFAEMKKLNMLEKEVANYPTTQKMYQKLNTLAQEKPNILHFFSIGKTIEGRDIMVMKISDNVQETENEPRVKLIANMHGDEVVGRELLVKFIEHIVNRYENRMDPFIDLVNNSEIYILPSLNPDGFESRQRGNANNVDLNRNFPNSISNDADALSNRQPETKAFMAFESQIPSSLSANFHGGTVVVNYPWDNTRSLPPYVDLVRELALIYAQENSEMSNSREFRDGVTNGYQWYSINGSLQDWSYYYRNNLQMTVELSEQKWPNYSTIDQYWQLNKKSLIAFISKIHQGAGFAFNTPNISGNVEVVNLQNHSKQSFKFDKSYFYKTLPMGEFKFNIRTNAGSTYSVSAIVDGELMRDNGNIQHIQ